MRVIKESLWQELADITDKTQLEWREVFQDLNHHGCITAGRWWGLATWCVKCHHHIAVYTPDVLPLCPKCGHDQFQRRPLSPRVKQNGNGVVFGVCSPPRGRGPG